MEFVYSDPTRVYLTGVDHRKDDLKRALTYQDKKIDFEIKKFKNNPWFITKYGEDAFIEKLEELKAQRYKCLLFEDDLGIWTYSGLIPRVTEFLGKDKIASKFEYSAPKSKLIPWAKKPEHALRPYQEEAINQLILHGHAGVEIGTGLGKSFIILNLAKHYGLKTVVMAPSVSIAGQLYKEFKTHFGQKYVGQFYGGKKECKKLFVIGVAASLTRVEEGSDAFDELSKTQVFIADESHQCPASTLASVCFGLVKDAPYRFFFSGTQVRNDGLDMLLEAITGPIVSRMTVREGVDQGYLAKPVFKMITTYSDSQYFSKDSNAMTRKHLFYNKTVNKIAADIANKSIELLNRPVLILVDEVEQFNHLLPMLRHKAGFAHGGLNDTNRDKVPKAYWDSDPDQLVSDFNAGRIPILVGTSCIATGTDIKAVRTMVYLRGGTSEIEVKQGVGRCTRLVPGKTDCYVFDFDVVNVDCLNRHAEARRYLYNEIYGPVEDITYG